MRSQTRHQNKHDFKHVTVLNVKTNRWFVDITRTPKHVSRIKHTSKHITNNKNTP
jgi:hypothetical protein